MARVGWRIVWDLYWVLVCCMPLGLASAVLVTGPGARLLAGCGALVMGSGVYFLISSLGYFA